VSQRIGHDARAQLIIVCTGEGQHKERTIRHLLLDPLTPISAAGIVTAATGPQRGGQNDPNAHAGDHGKWRFRCSEPGCPDKPVSADRLNLVMERIADTPERLLKLELGEFARLL